MGDEISAFLIDQLFGYRVTLCSPDERGHLVAAGSILHRANRSSHVWGTGLLDPSYPLRDLAPGRIHAVRGKLTHLQLRKAGVIRRHLPLGDPGFLVGALSFARPSEQRYRIGVAAHYVDRGDPWVRVALAAPGIADLDVHLDPVDFLERMRACETVISSSLHGLIFAEALGIPNVWVKLSNKVKGDGFKFRDWFSLAARPQSAPLLPEIGWHAMARKAALHDMRIDRDELIAAFPASEADIFS